jgi:hypothetical protein
MKAIRNIFSKIVHHFNWLAPLTINCGDSMNFLGRNYHRGNMSNKLQINDRVIIRYTNTSQAKKDYPAKIVARKINGRDGKAEGLIWVLMAVGILDNKDWKGAWMNEYLFSRLELVSRNYKLNQ